MYYIISGTVYLIEREQTVKAIKNDVRRARKNQAKEAERLKAQAAAEGRVLEAPSPQAFKSDLPVHVLSANEFVKKNAKQTFGNDRVLTTCSFRPAYGLAMGERVRILAVPLEEVKKALAIVENSGEHRERLEFFRSFRWFKAMTQVQKNKFLNATRRVAFWPGQKIINEGENSRYLYLLQSGSVTLQCTKTGGAFRELEHTEDPTRRAREEEFNKMRNPFKKPSAIDRQRLGQKRGMLPLEDKFGTIHENGYVSKTLKTVQLGQVSQGEWLGQELLFWKSPKTEVFNYTAVAQARSVAYRIGLSDVGKIPQIVRRQLEEVASLRTTIIQQRYM